MPWESCLEFFSRLKSRFREKSDLPVHHNLFITLLWGPSHFHVSYPDCVIMRVKCIDYKGKGILNSHLGSNSDPCYMYIQNRVIKRLSSGLSDGLLSPRISSK